MGGGLFGTPLYLNEKCIAFAGFVLAVYFMPHQKAWQHEVVFAFILAMLAYVLMAWYDYIYDCNDKLGPTLLGGLIGWAKPYGGVPPGTKELPIKYKKIVAAFDIVVFIVLLCLVFYPYISFMK
jgi:UDP-N-acetylmuramyl pentapeptide phosphotransferase/UDP-N-acetylglucosamine-1-phosphate transferase